MIFSAPTPPPFSAAVLAGGHSTRMGSDKAFLRVGGELLIERQLRCLSECGGAEILVSGRLGVDYSSCNARVVLDEHPDSGPLGGVAALLHAATLPMLVVLAVDMPAMTSMMLRRIVKSATRDAGCVPIDEGGVQPLAAMYPKSVLPLAEDCLRRRQNSMRSFVNLALEGGLVQLLQIRPEESVHFSNWNLPSDWTAVVIP